MLVLSGPLLKPQINRILENPTRICFKSVFLTILKVRLCVYTIVNNLRFQADNFTTKRFAISRNHEKTLLKPNRILFVQFAGLILRANKRYSQTVSKSFHLSQACIDLSQTPGDKDVQVQVHLTSESENYILCTLDRKNNLQARLDLVFSEGDDIAFSCIGTYINAKYFCDSVFN